MTKITNFGRREHQVVSARIDQLLKALGEELGLKLKTHGGQHGATGGMIRINVEVEDTGNGMSAAESNFRSCATLVGLKPDWFGATFYYQGAAYQIAGLNLGAPKYPVSVERQHDRKAFKMTASMVQSAVMAEVAKGRIAA